MPGKSAEAIDRHIRAHTPAPGAWTMLGEERVKLGPVSLIGVDPALEGVLPATGKVGADVSIEDAQGYARTAALNALAAIETSAPTLPVAGRTPSTTGSIE